MQFASLFLALSVMFLMASPIATARTSEIRPLVDGERLVVDAEALEHYERLRAATDIGARVPRAADFDKVVYIDPSAASDGSGTSAEDPRNSWAEVDFASGTAYLQRVGTTALMDALIEDVPANVLIGAYGTGPRPILSSSASPGGDVAIINLSNASTGVVIRDLHIRAPTVVACINLRWSTGAILYNNELEESIWGIRAFNDDHKIFGNIIHNIGDDGIFVQTASGIEIAWNLICNVNTRWQEPYTPESIASGDSIQLFQSGDWHVHHNVMDRSDSGNKFCFIANTNTGPGLLEHNFMVGPKAGGDGGSTVYLGSSHEGTPFTVRYNTFVRSGVGVLWNHHDNLLVFGNFFRDNAGGINNNGNQAAYYHNVFWNSGGQIMRNGGKLANNIIDTRQPENEIVGFTFNDHNLYTTRIIEGGPGNLLGDPLFVDSENGDFRLKADSPAIDAGMDLGSAVPKADRVGTSLPQGTAPDIGAFEYAKTEPGNDP